MPLYVTEWVLFNGKLPNQGSYILQLYIAARFVASMHGTYGIVISERGSSSTKHCQINRDYLSPKV